MLFNSIGFAVFFPVVTVIYFILPQRIRWLWLLAASVYFYMSFIPVYILVLLFLILWDYAAGLAIEAASGARRRLLLSSSVAANVAALAAFKYSSSWSALTGLPALVMPLGLSFHTFQSMAYTIEVYRGRQKAERNLGIYALYVMFYPQLAAGPIERPGHLLPQFREERRFDVSRALDGARLMSAGLFKKAVIADSLALLVDRVYGRPASFPGGTLWLATYLFAFQVYCDFSGYTDIARGAARVMGFELVENFKSPFLADSLPEFWRRWHISLSTWFRDYVYIPLGGNRVSAGRHWLNLLAVFAISGLWHGAGRNFLVFGLFHGLGMIAYRVTEPLRRKTAASLGLAARPRLARWLGIAATFQFFAFSLVFFRSASWSDARLIASRLLSSLGVTGLAAAEMVFAAALICSLGIVGRLRGDAASAKTQAPLPSWQRWTANYAAGLCLIGLALMRLNHLAAEPRTFVYFQF